jgi:Na+-transporting methylmalonyl-CoA/oxaloacetate decarboxylase gamma subunit
MDFHPILGATQSAEVADTLPYLTGMLVVFATLAALWGVCALSAAVIRILVPEPAPAPPTELRPATAPDADPAGIDPEIVAVISAAIASVTGSSHRIVSIKLRSSSWEKAGRHSVLTSHKIR